VGDSAHNLDSGDPCDSGASALADRARPEEPIVSSKNKGGREAKKPKASHNVKATGQTPQPTAIDAINHKAAGKH
jgi:hypothetical protein